MGRFERNGKKLLGTNSEEFHDAMREAGPVECKVCHHKIGDGNKGQNIAVCEGCIEYFCVDHIWRHPDCEEGR